MKIVSISLYGSDPLYVNGAFANERALAEVYPGWVLRFYTDNEAFCSAAHAPCVQVIRMNNSVGSSGMFWRFLAAAEKDVECVIFRDADSRLNVREKAAVDAWLAGGRRFHVMRDHPHHAYWPMLGGMWGVRGGVLTDVAAKIAAWPRHTEKLDDMIWLEEVIWPMAVNDMLHHSSVATQHPFAIPFPKHAPYAGFVGEIVRA